MRNAKEVLFGVILLLVLTFTITACGSSGGPKEKQSQEGASKGVPTVINIGTAPSGSAFYALGVKMSDLITKYVPGYTATAQPTGASVENVKRMAGGDLQMGFAFGGNLYYALKGEKFFDKKYDVRAIIAGHPATWMLIVREDSGIKDWTDLKGKKIASNPPGGGMGNDIWLSVLEFYGLKESDLAKVSKIPNLDDAVQQIKDRNLDGVCWPVAKGGTSALTDLANSVKVRWIGVSEEGIKYVINKYPFLSRVTVPAGSNKGQDNDVSAIGDICHIFVRADMPEDQVYNITKAIMDHAADLKEAVPCGEDYTLQNAVITAKTIPFHPGAIKYYKEKGVWKE
jgi:TRAP transporter TAXI family solute receptor